MIEKKIKFSKFRIEPYLQSQFRIYYEDKFIIVLKCTADSPQHLKLSDKTSKGAKSLKKYNLYEEKIVHKLTNWILVYEKKRNLEKTNKKKEKKIMGKTTQIKPNLNIQNYNELEKVFEVLIPNRKVELEILVSVVSSLRFSIGDAIYLILIDKSGSGKTTLCDCFGDTNFSGQVDDLTGQGMAPGTATEDQSVHALLNIMKNKTMFINDLSLVLASNENKVNKFLGFLTNSFGRKKGIKKMSPGAGNVRYGGLFNAVFGATFDLYYGNYNRFNKDGRYLTYKLPKINEEEIFMEDLDAPDVYSISSAIFGFLENNLKSSLPKIKIPHELMRYVWEFMKLRSYYSAVHKKQLEFSFQQKGITTILRSAKQMKMLCCARAYVRGRTVVNKEDIELFKPLFLGLDNDNDKRKKVDCLLTDSNYKSKENFDPYELFECVGGVYPKKNKK